MSTDLFTRDGLGSGQGGVWAYVSASRLAKWLFCPLAFKFLCGQPHNSRYVVFGIMLRSSLLALDSRLISLCEAT